MTSEPINVDAILASLGPEFANPGVDRWGGANLTNCGECEACRTYVSRLWAEDWDSAEDAVYDEH